MLRVLASDLRKLFRDKTFLASMEANVSYALVIAVLLKIVKYFFIHESDLAAEDTCFTFQGISIFLVTASTLFTTISEYSDGCIRNKIISGARRHEVFLSAMICGMIQGLVHALIACFTSVLICFTLSSGFAILTAAEVINYWLLTALVCVTLGGFTTSLIMILGKSRFSYITGIALAVGMKIFSMEILDKLYPENGVCTLTGARLHIYLFFDRFVPYLHVTMPPHWPVADYLAGNLGLLLLATAAGLVLFRKKELQ
ncbi:MAG: hypothetical protein K6F63_08500 [Lachnospiraceae bacterium]|nr:hypothetical protein [Lachnospiraceae bacterium]